MQRHLNLWLRGLVSILLWTGKTAPNLEIRQPQFHMQISRRILLSVLSSNDVPIQLQGRVKVGYTSVISPEPGVLEIESSDLR